MTLLTMVGAAQDTLSHPRSTVVISSTDDNVRILLALAQQEGRELARRAAWQALTTEKTFTSTAAAIQTSAVPSDFDYLVNDSMYNRTNRRRVTGPLSAREWQAQQALSVSLMTDAFRIRGGDILITPTPTAGETYAYEYVSKNWCQTGSTGQAAWAADADTGILDENLMLLGVIWRFRKARGFDYAEEFNTYEKEVEQAIMRDGAKRVLNYGQNNSLVLHDPQLVITEGSWNL